MKKYYKTIILSLALLAAPAIVLAAEIREVAFLPEQAEQILEIVNLILAVLAAAFAVKLAALSQGGELEKTWNLLALSACAFAVVEILGALKEFDILEITGLIEVFEVVFVALLAYAFYKTRKILLKRIMGK